MHSLYWRIFFSFWLALALILVGTVILAVNAALHNRNLRPWIQREQLYLQAEGVFRTGGADALVKWVNGMRDDETFDRVFVIDPTGKEMTGPEKQQTLETAVNQRLAQKVQELMKSAAIVNKVPPPAQQAGMGMPG